MRRLFTGFLVSIQVFVLQGCSSSSGFSGGGEQIEQQPAKPKAESSEDARQKEDEKQTEKPAPRTKQEPGTQEGRTDTWTSSGTYTSTEASVGTGPGAGVGGGAGAGGGLGAGGGGNVATATEVQTGEHLSLAENSACGQEAKNGLAYVGYTSINWQKSYMVRLDGNQCAVAVVAFDPKQQQESGFEVVCACPAP